MNTTLSMKEYISIMEQVELTEDQQHQISEMLTEGLLDKLGKNSLIGFLKIIKVLWDAGWYTIAHPIKTVKNVYQASKYAIGAGIAAGTAYGTYAVKPYVDEAYMIWQLGQRFAETLGNIKITNISSYRAAIDALRQLPSLGNWTNLTIEQKIEVMNKLGLSSDAYGDLLRYIFQVAGDFALDNAWVILALSLSIVAARFISRFVSDKLQDKIDSLSNTSDNEKQTPAQVTDQFTDKKLLR